MECPGCGQEVNSSDTYCIGCGGKLPVERAFTKLCPECKSEIPHAGQKFCNGCGTQLLFEQEGYSECQPVRATEHHSPSQPVKGASGDLPICPTCRQTRLIWGTEPNPAWVWIMFIVGVLLTGVGGWILWGIAIYFLWIKPKPLIPYCPKCLAFHPESAP